MTRYFLMHCSRSDDWEDHEYALVTITPELARLVFERRRAFAAAKAADAELDQIAWWDGSALVLENDEDDGEKTVYAAGEAAGVDASQLDREEIAEVSAEVLTVLEKYAGRTECDRMRIDERGVWWTCFPRHTDVRVSTATLPFNLFEACLGDAR